MRLTALRRAGDGRVALEVEGRPWRVVPEDVVVRARLFAGMELEREALRRVRRELARARAVEIAGRTLARRDVSVRTLEARLERAHVDRGAAAETVAALKRVGALEDARYARGRADALARRGYGDVAIAARLESEGVDAADARSAIAMLPAEPERAGALIEGEADPRKAARLLARRGFAPETVETAVPGLDWEASGGLGYAYSD